MNGERSPHSDPIIVIDTARFLTDHPENAGVSDAIKLARAYVSLFEQNEFHTGEVAMLSEKLDGLREQFEAVSSLLVELARWSRVAERNGDLHARIASALAMSEQERAEQIGRSNRAILEVEARYADLKEQFEALHAAAVRLIEREEADDEAVRTLMEVDTGDDAQEYQRLTRQTADEAFSMLKALVSSPAREPHKSPCPNCGSSTWVLRWGKTDGLEEGCNKCRPLPDHAPASSHDCKRHEQFDRTLCACGSMHWYCSECGRQTDACDPAKGPT